ncbi:MAG: GNAT family N-acetyltransferase [Nocardioidaceae bacterium]|nr:GNAT family N-acetyltransferase [Nocardioidaceae bacterium]
MAVIVKELTDDDAGALGSLWQAANAARRARLGATPLDHSGSVLERPGAFGVGLFEGERMLALAVGMPALADDARSGCNIPGLAHISSVATHPDLWGRGLAARCLRALMGQATRRGYARAQLFTHFTNVGAQRLYDREGWQRSGRRRTDDNGEEIVHFVRELPVPAPHYRPAARLLCLDDRERLLLLHWRDPLDGHQLWEPPGGGIEGGETADDAVRREWDEETGMAVPEMNSEPTRVARDVWWNGTRIVTDEYFFLGRRRAGDTSVPTDLPEADAPAQLGHAWVHWAELERLDDPVEPDLAPVLRRLAPEGPWAEKSA